MLHHIYATSCYYATLLDQSPPPPNSRSMPYFLVVASIVHVFKLFKGSVGAVRKFKFYRYSNLSSRQCFQIVPAPELKLCALPFSHERVAHRLVAGQPPRMCVYC